ncbi:MAG: YbhB/YbcL family Raf kinase inhibitor-like protein [Patescibacteria group bacterium]
MRLFVGALGIVIVIVIVFLSQRSSLNKNEVTINNMSDFLLSSPEFKTNSFIPKRFTCDGENISPRLEIKNVPADAKSLVLIMDDPDATGGVTWDHWLLWNIEPETQFIHEDDVPLGAFQGTTSFGEMRYGGPCPPEGSKPHRYMFKLYALDERLTLSRGATKSQIEKAMAGHILGQAVFTGLYERK